MTMHRRSFTPALALAAGMAPLSSRAQTAGRTARVGVLSSGAPLTDAQLQQRPFNLEMRRLGWIEGQNLVVMRLYADGKPDRMSAFAQELVDAKVDVIMATASPDAEYARRLTSTLPIVTVYSGLDPIADGLIASFARPGGNVTGVSRMLGETRAKRLELIKTLLPAAGRVAVLAPPQRTYPGQQVQFEAALRKAARVLRIELDFHWYANQDELMAVFPALASARTQAFLLEPTYQTYANRGRIAELALKHRLPGVFTLREYAQAGGLMSYGPDWSTIERQVAQQVDRILRGAKPGEMPMEQPTRFDLVLNLKTAKALGISFPKSLLQRAEELIE
jgi:putative tryptophan/tyrosine transport system substrate-binding protein